MQLSTLINAFFILPAAYDRQVMGIQLDSRAIEKQEVFCALDGHSEVGRHFIPAAIANGACAVLLESKANSLSFEKDIPIISIENLRAKLSAIATRFYQEPTKQMRMIGITGTSGKTSCSHLINQLLASLHTRTGVIGTLGSGIYSEQAYQEIQSAGLTTPDPIGLQKLLRQFADLKTKTVAMEVSSHSIAQSRTAAIQYQIAAYTNLSPEHLDYHHDMESYAAVKKQFLFSAQTDCVILNVDDDYGRKWLPHLTEKKIVYPYSCEQILPQATAIYATNLKQISEGFSGKIISPWGTGNFSLPLLGKFNLSNALLSLAAACLSGVKYREALAALADLKPIDGRMQLIKVPHLPTVVVDYAHKPDALKKVLQAIRAHASGNVICVFGCGGERDRQKRPLMATIAESLATQIILTNDNPRHEEPQQIINEILTGFQHPEKVSVQLDRALAIAEGIARANPDDYVLIAGRGGERFQKIGDQLLAFDDVEIVKRYIANQSVN